MTIKLDIKPINIKIEIPGYGEFTVTPLGAGAEAEVRIAFREMDEALKKAKEYQSLVDREQAGEKLDTESEEYKLAIEALSIVGDLSDKARDIVMDKMREVIKGKNVDKLFNDFTYKQIQEIYRKAIEEDGEAV